VTSNKEALTRLSESIIAQLKVVQGALADQDKDNEDLKPFQKYFGPFALKLGLLTRRRFAGHCERPRGSSSN